MLQSNIKISNLKYEIAAPTNCCTKPVYKMVESRVQKLHMKKEEEKSGEKKKKVVAEARSPSTTTGNRCPQHCLSVLSSKSATFAILDLSSPTMLGASKVADGAGVEGSSTTTITRFNQLPPIPSITSTGSFHQHGQHGARCRRRTAHRSCRIHRP